MKKIYHIIILATLLPAMTFAQLKVDSNGRVGIHTDPQVSAGLKVSSPTDGTGRAAVFTTSDSQVVQISTSNSNSTKPYSRALYVANFYDSGGTNLGVMSLVNNNRTNHGISIGLIGAVNPKSHGYNQGVLGTVSNGKYGAGIFGTTINPTSAMSTYFDGVYAGYFDGNVKITGTINGTFLSDSDGDLKENIADIGNAKESTLNRISLLSPVSFQYKLKEQERPSIKIEKDSTIDEFDETYEDDMAYYYENKRKLAEKTHFGFIAQELQQIYPELVYEQDNGYLAINYVELIPVLVQSIKELNAKVEELSAPRPAKAQAMNATADVETADFYSAAMGQNVPNPFSERTEIAITLPENVKKAMLYIYDMTGKQVEQHEVEGRGATSMTIYADRMNAGMYIYALVADGKVVTSKKMIVTK